MNDWSDRIIQLPPLPADGSMLVEFGADWDSLGRLWLMLLAMAVRDLATSVHYHPWRPDGHLSYVRAGVRRSLVPPPPKAARQVMLAAGALACGSRSGALSRRRFGYPLRASGRVLLSGERGPTEWVGVVWSVSRVGGVEWRRIDDTDGSDRFPRV